MQFQIVIKGTDNKSRLVAFRPMKNQVVVF